MPICWCHQHGLRAFFSIPFVGCRIYSQELSCSQQRYFPLIFYLVNISSFFLKVGWSWYQLLVLMEKSLRKCCISVFEELTHYCNTAEWFLREVNLNAATVDYWHFFRSLRSGECVTMWPWRFWCIDKVWSGHWYISVDISHDCQALSQLLYLLSTPQSWVDSSSPASLELEVTRWLFGTQSSFSFGYHLIIIAVSSCWFCWKGRRLDNLRFPMCTANVKTEDAWLLVGKISSLLPRSPWK